jgi:peptidyl-prolyl cis-trans isomerase D
MLSAMRRNSRHAIIYVLFGILIAAFVISFGPGSRGFGYQGVSSAYAVKVGGASVSEQEFHFAYVALNFTQVPVQTARDYRAKELVMDKLIERELLANEADKLGFSVPAKQVEDMIADGHYMVLGSLRPVDPYAFKNGKFDYERFKTLAQNRLGVTVKHLVEIQQRELLANQVRQLLRAGSKVAPDDVKQQFVDRGTQVALEYARFGARKYEEQIGEPAAADVDAYITTHADQLKKSYEDRSFLYKNLEKQAKLRHIVVDAPKEAPADAAGAAKAKIDGALARIKAGTPFAAVAKEVSTDTRTKGRGGEIGWRKKGLTGFGDAVDTKLFAAKPGTLIGPERTERGFELIEVESFREGDVPLAEAQRELAAEEVRKQKAMEMAKADAQAVVDRVKKGDKLEAIVPKDTPDPNETAQERQMKQIMAAAGGEAVKLQETALFSRRGDMVQDIGISKALAKKAFELKPGEVAGPFDVGQAWVVVRLKEHHDADLADYEKRKVEIARESQRTKWNELVESWSRQRCVEVRDDGRIKVNPEALEYEGIGKGAVKYEPCAPPKLNPMGM